VGPDTLLVGVSDEEHFGAGGPLHDSGSVAIDVLPVNDAPELTLPEAQVVDEDVDLLVQGLSIKDVDAGNGALEVTLRVENGTLTVGQIEGLTFTEGLGSGGAVVTFTGKLPDVNRALATLVYRGGENYYGDDRLSITVDDGGNSGAGDKLQDSGNVDIKVLPVNDAPVAQREKYAIRGDEVLLVSAQDGLLANDSDIDGDRLGAVLVRPPLRGKVWLGANGSFRYVPDPSYIGNDSFVYVASDGKAVSAPTLVIVKVSAPTSPVETDPGTAKDPTNSGSTGTTPASQTLDPTKHLTALVDAQLPEGIGESYSVARVAGRAQTGLIVSQVAGLDTDRSSSAELVNLSGAGDVGESRLSARARYLEEVVELTAAPIQYVTTVPDLILQGVDVATLSNDVVELDIVLDDATALHRLMVGSAVGITTGLTVGYVFWTVRAGYLLTSLVAQMPAWRFVDPLPILNSFDAETTHTDTDSLESIAGSGAEEA
jgi:hypothetical protein